MTSRVFEVRNSTDLVDPFEYLRVGKLETDCQGRRSAVMMELGTALPLGGHDYSNFSTAVGKLIFMAGCFAQVDPLC